MGKDGNMHDFPLERVYAHELGHIALGNFAEDLDATDEEMLHAEHDTVDRENEVMSGFEGQIERGDYDAKDALGTRGFEFAEIRHDLKDTFECAINPDSWPKKELQLDMESNGLASPEIEEMEIDPALLEEIENPEQSAISPQDVSWQTTSQPTQFAQMAPESQMASTPTSLAPQGIDFGFNDPTTRYAGDAPVIINASTADPALQIEPSIIAAAQAEITSGESVARAPVFTISNPAISTFT